LAILVVSCINLFKAFVGKVKNTKYSIILLVILQNLSAKSGFSETKPILNCSQVIALKSIGFEAY
jgi:hypothetical protein